MIEPLTESPLSPMSTLGPYRVDDYFDLPDEPRCELIYGRFYMAAAPIVRHQIIVMALGRTLDEHATAGGDLALAAPVDVTLAEHSVVQPDLVYVSADRRGIVGDRIQGAPDLIVEVLSPGTALSDRGEKLRLYAESGVKEYWIVDHRVRSFEFLVNEDGRFVVALAQDDIYHSAAVPGLSIDLAAFWKDVEARAG